MELFTKLFGDLLVFVYHCFDRIVIHGYLSGLSRPEQVVYFFRQVLGLAAVDKEVLSRRTTAYQQWVEALARNHAVLIEWAESGVRKEDHVRPGLKRMEKNKAWGVYFLFKSMEQGHTFRISHPKFPAKDPHSRILAHQRSRHTHYYFYIRDEVLGPFPMRISSFFPFQATYYLNGHSFMERERERTQVKFRKNDNAFLAVDDVAHLQAAADRFSPEIEIFGMRLTRQFKGKLANVVEQVEHGHHVFRAYCKNACIKQYEKFALFLRNEICSNNLSDFGLKKGLDHLDAVRIRFQTVTERFAVQQAQWLNVHVDFPLLPRIALPVRIGAVPYPGLKLHDARLIRLFEVLLHNGSLLTGWSSRQIHRAVLTSFRLSESQYGLNQLRYDLRRVKGRALLQRDGKRYACRLTAKGVDIALLFLFFHKRLCGPLANSRFHHRPSPDHKPHSQLENAYYKADRAIEEIVRLLAA